MTKKNEKYGARLTSNHEQMLIRHLQEEWRMAEKAEKKHELVSKAKQAGIALGKGLLALALVSGILTIAVAAPGVFSAFGRSSGGTRRYFKTDKMSHTLSNGSSKKYWRYVKTSENSFRIELTSRGRKVALQHALNDFKLQSRPSWDGKWRMVMFDISEKNSGARDGLRRKLHLIGMYPLQESVFIFPYPCLEDVLMWAELFGLNKEVVIVEAAISSHHEAELLSIFNISRPR